MRQSLSQVLSDLEARSPLPRLHEQLRNGSHFTRALVDADWQAIGATLRSVKGAGSGDLEQANRQLELLVAEDATRAVTAYNGACIAARLVRICGDTDASESECLKRRSVQLLRHVFMELNYQIGDIAHDLDLAPLHNDAEFAALVFAVVSPTQPWDPVQRTAFIAEFPEWCGDVERLAGILQPTSNSDFRSGISLTIGSIEHAARQVKETWQPVLAQPAAWSAGVLQD